MGEPADEWERSERTRYIWQTDVLPATGASISWDEVFAALADPISRSTLQYLAFRDGRASMVELSGFVARRQVAAGAETISAETVRRIRTQLHHVHVPKLADGGLVERPGDSEEVTITALGLHVLALLSE